jgi:hypothetical protein
VSTSADGARLHDADPVPLERGGHRPEVGRLETLRDVADACDRYAELLEELSSAAGWWTNRSRAGASPAFLNVCGTSGGAAMQVPAPARIVRAVVVAYQTGAVEADGLT